MQKEPGKRVSFHNLGCKVNSYETEAMIKQFTGHGYRLVDFTEPADVCIVNTCTVTGIADRKSRQMLHRARALNPEALVVAVGCYVQADKDRALADEAIDLVIGNNEKSRAYELVTARESLVSDIAHETCFDEMYLEGTSIHTRAFIKVQDGCNQFCSYCLIPYVRGRVRSRSIDSVTAEVRRLYDNGCREVVLTGIHLSSYGSIGVVREMGPELIRLIRAVSEAAPGCRIRLGSLEPRIITPDFVQGLAAIPGVCPHFHLSLQSGCDATLKRMNRHYTCDEYAAGLQLLRDTFAHPALCTDVIVGFPGETEEEFNETYEFLKKINLYEMHIFKYSLRRGTAAERLPGRVPPDIMEQRSNILLELSEVNKKYFIDYYEGRSTKVLLEEEEITDEGAFLTGYNPEYVRFRIPAEGHRIGEIIEVNN